MHCGNRAATILANGQVSDAFACSTPYFIARYFRLECGGSQNADIYDDCGQSRS
jgi:hypothetical protein